MIGMTLSAWLVGALIATATIHCKDIENGSTKRIQKLLDQLYKNQKYINSLNNSGVSDETPVRKAMKQFIADSETVGKLMHRDDVLDSPYLQQLRVRLQDDHLDIYSVKDDTFKVLLYIDEPNKYLIDVEMDKMKETKENLTKLLDNSKRNEIKDAKQYVKSARLAMPHLFKIMKRRCPADLKMKLEQSLRTLNTSDGISKANDLIKSIIKLAQKYYKQIDYTDYKIGAEPIGGMQNITDEAATIGSYLYRIQSNITGLRFAMLIQPNYTETAIRKAKQYLMTAASKLRELSKASNIQPLSIYAERVENFAKHLKTKNDVKLGLGLLETAMHYDERYSVKMSLDSYVIIIKECQTEVERLIDIAKYSDRKEMFYEVVETFKGTMPQLKDALQQLAVRKHMKGYSNINIKLQDILDDIRDSKEELNYTYTLPTRKKFLKNMLNIDEAITEFLKKNPNL